MYKIKITEKVHSSDEWGNDSPTHISVVLDKKTITWIKNLAATVKKLKVYGIEDFNYLPTYMIADEEDENEDPINLQEWDGATECCMIHVHKDSFRWDALIKHSSISLESESIDFKYLQKLIRIAEKPLSEMPKYIHHENIDIRDTAKMRLEEGI
jgi:hypothetical protein